MIKNATIGQAFTFGKYANEPIEWVVIDKKPSCTTLLSRHILDAKVFYHDCIYTSWENSFIRRWLNKDFYDLAFDDNEKKLILKSHICTKSCTGYEPCGSENTEDKVFLLDAQEVNEYLSGKDYLFAQPTENALKNSKDLSDFSALLALYDNVKNFWWWLRSYGTEPNNMGIVWSDGTVSQVAHFVNFEHGIRPAINIKI